jgi:urate oxidase
MPAKLVHHAYGKFDVRLTKVSRHPDRHELKELSVDVQLYGDDFAATYLTGDNSKVVATDSMKNTVYVLAKRHPIDSIDDFGAELVRHFVGTYAQVSSAEVWIKQRAWQRITTNGKPHRHAFVAGGDELRTCSVGYVHGGVTHHAGLENLVVLKTTDSAFTGYVRDEYTTLPETLDRIFATSVKATWTYEPGLPADGWNERFTAVRQAMLDVFADHKSLSVQQTLYAMGEAVLAGCPHVRLIRIEMPNQHRIPFNFEPLGLTFENDVYVPTEQPYGFIHAIITRE